MMLWLSNTTSSIKRPEFHQLPLRGQGQFAAAVVAIEAAVKHRIGANPAVIMKTIG